MQWVSMEMAAAKSVEADIDERNNLDCTAYA